jgi:hypothetical protein
LILSCTEFTLMNGYFVDFLMIHDFGYGVEASSEQEMDWAIHNDHAGDAGHEDGIEEEELDPEQRQQIALKITQLNDDYRKNSIPAQWVLTPGVEEAKLTFIKDVTSVLWTSIRAITRMESMILGRL